MNRVGPQPSIPPPPDLSDARHVPGQPDPTFTIFEQGERYALAVGDGEHSSAHAIWDLAEGRWVEFFYSSLAKDRARLRWESLERHGGTPFWSRATPLWLTLHVLVGLLGMGFVAVLISFFIAVAAGIDLDEMGQSGAWVAPAWLAPLGGWLGFVYLRKSMRVRIALLVVGTLIGGLSWVLSAGI